MISSATARFRLFSKSLKSFRTTCLFSEAIFALLWAGRLYHSRAAVGRLLLARWNGQLGRSGITLGQSTRAARATGVDALAQGSQQARKRHFAEAMGIPTSREYSRRGYFGPLGQDREPRRGQTGACPSHMLFRASLKLINSRSQEFSC